MNQLIKKRIENYIKYLLELSSREERAALADLRCGFSKTTETRAWARFGEFCHLNIEKERIVFQTIGAGYATNPNNDETLSANLGDVARQLSKVHNSFEITFRQILACKTTRDVCQCLRGFLQATKAENISVPWKNLLWDLLLWERKPEEIKSRWASRYWYDPKEDTENIHSEVDSQEANEK